MNNNMLKFSVLLVVFLLFNCSATSVRIPEPAAPKPEVTPADFLILDRDLSEIKLEDMIGSLKGADVIFIGETHNDPVAHHIEFEVVKGVYEITGKAAVSMEMFERDVQYVLDEYLNGIIQESFLIKDARAWNNYDSDYKPVVEFAKEKNLDVIAANAPRRYVRIVSTKGYEGLDELTPEALKYLPPLPVKMPPDETYQKKFISLMMGSMPAMTPRTETEKKEETEERPPMMHQANDRIMRSFYAQVLWDATMAYSIGEYHKNNSGTPVIHFNGSFHSEEGLGIVQHLQRDFPDMKIVTITVKSLESFPEYDREDIKNAGDFIVIANGKMPRTY